MLGVIRLEVPSSQPQSLIDALGAFVDGPQGPICIGQARPMDTDQGLLYFLTAFGEANAALFAGDVHFRWMSGLTELEFTADETVAFEADRLHGDLESPMLLHFREALAMPETSVDEHLVAFPNPFQKFFSLQWYRGTLNQVKRISHQLAPRLIGYGEIRCVDNLNLFV